MSRFRSLAFLPLILWYLMGCSLWTLQTEKDPPQEATLSDLVRGLTQPTDQLENLKALISVEVSGHSSITVSLSWRKPRKIKLMGFDPFGSTLFRVSVEGERVEWQIPGRPPVVFESMDSLQSSPSILHPGFPVSIRELVEVTHAITGPVTRENEIPVLETTWKHYILSFIRMENGVGRLTKRFWIQRKDLSLVRQDFYREGGTQGIKLDFDDYRPGRLGPWPYRVTVHVPHEKGSLELVFKEVIINQAESYQRESPTPLGFSGATSLLAGGSYSSSVLNRSSR